MKLTPSWPVYVSFNQEWNLTILNDEQFHNPSTAANAAVQRHASCRRDWPGGDYDGTRTRDLRSDNPIFFSTELRSHFNKAQKKIYTESNRSSCFTDKCSTSELLISSIKKYCCVRLWYRRWDLNPHAFPQKFLRLPCLPFQHFGIYNGEKCLTRYYCKSVSPNEP